jgi:high affinity sulfate transporter 1
LVSNTKDCPMEELDKLGEEGKIVTNDSTTDEKNETTPILHSSTSSARPRSTRYALSQFVQKLRRRGKPIRTQISPEAAEQYTIVMDTDEEGLERLYQAYSREQQSEPLKAECFKWLPFSARAWFHWSTFRRRFPYYVPIMMWLPQYEKKWILNDFFAGVAVAAMIIPQSLALALLAGLPPVYGLYSAWIAALIYAFMGNSRQMSCGPDTVASVLVGLTIQEQNPDDPAGFAHILALLAGLFLFTLGIFRFGFLDNVLSRPLLSGFINAVAAIIVMEQFDSIMGVPNPEAHEWHKIVHVFEHITEVNWQTIVIGVCSVIYLLAFRIANKWIQKSGTKRIWLTSIRFIPAILVVVILSTVFTYVFRLDKQGVRILGEINSKFPVPAPPPINSITDISDALQPALIIGILGFIESIIVAKYYAMKHHYGVSPNRELVALGIANLIGSFFKIYPSFGSLTRSAISDMAGARTQVYEIFVGLIVLFTILFMGPLFYYLPKSALAGIVVVAGIGIFELEDVLFLWRIRAYPALILLTGTFVCTIALGVELGLLIGLGISVFFIIQHTTFPHIVLLGRTPSGKYKDISQYADALTVPGVIIVRIDEALYFANIGPIKEMLSRIERLGSHKAHPTDLSSLPPLSAIIIDARNIFELDPSAIQILRDMVEDYKQRGIKVCFVKLRWNLKQSFLSANILHPLDGGLVFSRISDAVNWVEASMDKGFHGSYSSYIQSPHLEAATSPGQADSDTTSEEVRRKTPPTHTSNSFDASYGSFVDMSLGTPSLPSLSNSTARLPNVQSED